MNNSIRYPASYHQERLWFIDYFEKGKVYPSNPIYHNIPILLKLTGEVDESSLEQSLNQLLRRHQILNTNLVTDNNMLWQSVDLDRRLVLKVVITDKREPVGTLDSWREKAIEESKSPLRLDQDLLVRAVLYRISKNESLLSITVHHAIVDKWSIRMIVDELFVCYEALSQGKPSGLAEPELQFGDFVKWQKNLPDEFIEQSLFYWKYQLKEPLKALELPTNNRAAIHIYNGGQQQLSLKPSLCQRVDTFCTDQGISEYLFYLVAFQILLFRYSQQDEIILGVTDSGRDLPELEKLPGPVANLLALRSFIDSDSSIMDLIREVEKKLRDAKKFKTIPFDKLVLELNPKNDMSRTALFDVIYDFEADQDNPWYSGSIQVDRIPVDTGYGKYDLFLSIRKNRQDLSGTIVYNKELFEPFMVEQMSHHYSTILNAMIDDTSQTIGGFELLSSKEKTRQLSDWNGEPDEIVAHKALHRLIEEQAEKNPDNIAVVYQETRITYDSLNRKSNQIANLLLSEGVEPDSLVGVCLDRSIELIASILGVLKAGAAYLPLDPKYPEDRLDYMATDANVLLLICGDSSHEKFSAASFIPLTIKSVNDRLRDFSDRTPNIDTNPSDLAYCIYTSGSTGVPKGVLIEHRSVTALLLGNQSYFRFSSEDVWTLFHSICFDFSVWELFGSLVFGGKLVIVPETHLVDPAAFATLIHAEKVTVLNQTPGSFYNLADGLRANREKELFLRMVIFGGEALSQEKLKDWKADFPVVRLINMYGITETCVHVTLKELSEEDLQRPGSTIGKPLPTVQTLILDQHGQQLPVGVIGELHVGGSGLARGYQNNPELAEDRFIPNPFSESEGSRLYRTGDLAKYLPNGDMEYLGRIDNQVKIRGYRIELGEIESAIIRQPNIDNAVVLAQPSSTGEVSLVAYYIEDSVNEERDQNEIKDVLKNILPDYMVPSFYLKMESFPLNNNGKIDRSALPSLSLSSKKKGKSPDSELGKKLATLWKQLLDVEQIGVNDNFFEVGGNSLLAVKLHKNMQKALGGDFSVIDLFKYPTIQSFEDFLQKKGRMDQKSASSVRGNIENRRKKLRAGSGSIAIIGMSGRFPGAGNIDQFWKNLSSGVESIISLDEEELLKAGVPFETIHHPNYVKATPLPIDVELFDAAFFDLHPREVEIMEPQKRVLFECSWEALENAGYSKQDYEEEIGVFAGVGVNNYLLLNLLSRRDELKSINPISVLIGNGAGYVSTQISYKFNLTGPSVNIDTACSTSLVAVHQACNSLLLGECDMALAGGASIDLPQKTGYFYEEDGIASPDGHCRTFDANAKGTVRSSGGGMILLKRLEDAVSDRDSIHAIIKGSAINNDGSTKVGFTAPSVGRQIDVIEKAVEKAQLKADQIQYVEAHGTGTVLGDPIEVAALTEAYRKSTAKRQFCALGSVKTNIGHLDAGAGIAGLVKTVLSLKHGQIPPSLHFAEANPKIDFEDSPFFVNSKVREWKSAGDIRRAGVSSFGIGGTNAHVIIEEAPAVEKDFPSRECQLLLLSAKSENALRMVSKNLADHLEMNENVNLADVAFTLQEGRIPFPVRSIVVCKGRKDAIDMLRIPPHSQKIQPEGSKPRLCFMLPDLGSIRISMFADLFEREVFFREAMVRCDRIIKEKSDHDFLETLYPKDEERVEPGSLLQQVRFGRIAMFALEYSLCRLWIEWGIEPQMMIGHGLGEYVAACLAGVFSLEDAFSLVFSQGTQISTIDPVPQEFGSPQIPFISSVTGDWITKEQAIAPGYWAKPFGENVQLFKGVETLLNETNLTLLEVGLGMELGTLVCQHDENRQPTVVYSCRQAGPEENDHAAILGALGELWLAGITPDWERFYNDEKRSRIPLPTYPFERKRYWIDSVTTNTEGQETDLFKKKTNLDEWFYLPEWSRKNLMCNTMIDPGSWLVFCDAHGVTEKLIDSLGSGQQNIIRVVSGDQYHQLDENSFVVNPEKNEDYEQLFQILKTAGIVPDRIIHGWSITLESSEANPAWNDSDGRWQAKGMKSLIHIAQSLSDHFASVPIKLSVLFNHVHSVLGTELIIPQKATISGPCKVIPWEYPNIQCCHIDIDLQDISAPSGNGIIRQIIQEFESDFQVPLVAYRGCNRWVQQFEPVKLQKEEQSKNWISEAGTYLITGGLGGIGFVIANYFVDHGCKGLVLLGKTELPDRSEWECWLNEHDDSDPISEKVKKIQLLEKGGAKVFAASSGQFELKIVKKMIADVESELGTINGIVHAAGNAGGGIIQMKKEEDTNEVLNPKVQGTLLLEHLFKERKLDFFINFSSTASIIGYRGLVDYCAANSFLDAFALSRKNAPYCTPVTINWDVWKDVGMEANRSVPAQFQETFSSHLQNGIATEEGVEVFDRIMLVATSNRLSQVVVSTKEFKPTGYLEMHLTAIKNMSNKTVTAAQYSRPQISSEYRAPETDLEKAITGFWEESFGIRNIGVQDNFFELGGDSFLALGILNNIRDLVGEVLHLPIIFEVPTIKELAKYIEDEYLSEKENVEDKRESLTTPTIKPINEEKVALYEKKFRIHVPDRVTVEKKNKPTLFVLSAPRSGSTLLRVMLAGSPQLFAPPELGLLFYESLAERKAAHSQHTFGADEGLLQAIMTLKNCNEQQARSIVAELENERVTTAEAYCRLQEWCGSRMLVDKTPAYSSSIDIMKRGEKYFENARYIHLVRNPYGMIRSYNEARLDQFMDGKFRSELPFSRLELAELIWLTYNRNILNFLKDIPRERQLRVKYEKLVTTPQPVVEEMCLFLGIKYTQEMLDPYKEKTKRMTESINPATRMLGDHKFHAHDKIDPQIATSWKSAFKDDFLGVPTWQCAETLNYRDRIQGQKCSNIQVAQLIDLTEEETLGQIEDLSEEELNQQLSEMLN